MVNRVIRKLTSGDHFGELALINEEKRTLTVKAGSERVKLLTLDRNTFNRILGQIDRFLNRDYSKFMHDDTVIPGINSCNEMTDYLNQHNINRDLEDQNQWSHDSSELKDVFGNSVDPLAEKQLSFEMQRLQKQQIQ